VKYALLWFLVLDNTVKISPIVLGLLLRGKLGCARH